MLKETLKTSTFDTLFLSTLESKMILKQLKIESKKLRTRLFFKKGIIQSTMKFTKKMINKVFHYNFTAKKNKFLNFIFTTAHKNNISDTLKCMQSFNQFQQMDHSHPSTIHIIESIIKKVPVTHVLELGTYYGFCTLSIMKNLTKNGTITSIEQVKIQADFAKKIIEFANFSTQITIMHGTAEKKIPQLKQQYHLIYIDHDTSLVYQDLKSIVSYDLMKKGCKVIIPNILSQGHPNLFKCIEYMTNSVQFDVEIKYIKHSKNDSIYDALCIATYKP